MLSSVLRTPRAIQMNIEIMRAFVRLRRWLQTHRDLARRLDELEEKYDQRFEGVFDAIRHLLTEQEREIEHRSRRRIGFRSVAENEQARKARR